MKNESGRSMVEMLGVLAIIGVLSIGGIAGYTLAMRRYKANNIVNVMSLGAIYGMTAKGGVGLGAALTNVGADDAGFSMPKELNTTTGIQANSDGVVKANFQAGYGDICEIVADIVHNKSASGAVSGLTSTSSCTGENTDYVAAKFN